MHFCLKENPASVVVVFREEYGLDRESALKLCSGLGSGFRLGELCGAASGAALAIGLKHGQFVLVLYPYTYVPFENEPTIAALNQQILAMDEALIMGHK